VRASCLVCGGKASWSLGIRARRHGGNAVFAPELGAYLCDLHARSGAEILIAFQTMSTGRVVVTTINDGKTVSKINHAIGGAPERQEAMF